MECMIFLLFLRLSAALRPSYALLAAKNGLLVATASGPCAAHMVTSSSTACAAVSVSSRRSRASVIYANMIRIEMAWQSSCVVNGITHYKKTSSIVDQVMVAKVDEANMAVPEWHPLPFPGTTATRTIQLISCRVLSTMFCRWSRAWLETQTFHLRHVPISRLALLLGP